MDDSGTTISDDDILVTPLSTTAPRAEVDDPDDADTDDSDDSDMDDNDDSDMSDSDDTDADSDDT